MIPSLKNPGRNVKVELIYTQYKVKTKDNDLMGIKGGTKGTLHAFSCVYPNAGTIPTDTRKDGDFNAYEDMLKFITDGLQKKNSVDSTGLQYLEVAMGL